MSQLQMKVECPRCGKIWTAGRDQSEVPCDCHKYCDQGQKEGDCTLIGDPHVPTRFTAFVGLKVGSPADEYESEFVYKKWCSTHSRYTYKAPIVIPCHWEQWLAHRAPEKFRHQGLY